MRFLQTARSDILWGTLRNAPLVVLFVGAVWHWARERKISSITYVILGAAVGSLLISSTKSMASGYSVPGKITAVTFVTMSLFQVLLVAYLGTEAEWSNWRVDVGLGSVAGVCLAAAQGLATQGPPGINAILHSVALAAVGALGLLGMRKLKERTLFSALASALLLGIVMTLVAKAVDYQLILQ
jgi:hypothetical protein